MLYKAKVDIEQTQCEHNIQFFNVKPGGTQSDR